MAKSFFERLTGSIRINEGEPPGKEPPTADFRSKRRVKESPARELDARPERSERARIIHPVDTNPEREERPAAEAEVPDEEGQLTVDIFDDGAAIVIQSSVAGVKPEDIDISLQEDTLTIRGSRRRHREVEESNFYYKELYWGTFSRSIILPEEVDFAKADAAIKNGMITIRLPKKDRGEKKIRVKIE